MLSLRASPVCVNEQVESDAERHTVHVDSRDYLERDPDCGHETTKPLPVDIHSNHTGAEAELRQKPASKVEFMDGSHGFLHLWVPVDEGTVAFVSATADDYDRDAIVDTIREEYEAAAVRRAISRTNPSACP